MKNMKIHILDIFCVIVDNVSSLNLLPVHRSESMTARSSLLMTPRRVSVLRTSAAVPPCPGSALTMTVTMWQSVKQCKERWWGRSAMSDANISPAVACVGLVWGLVTAAAMLLCCCPQLHHQQQERGGQRTSPPRVLAADTAGYLCPALQPGNLYTHAAVTYLSLKCDIKMYFYWVFLCTHLHYMSSRAPAMNRFYRQRLCKSSSWSSLLVFILKFFNEVHRKYKNTIFGEGLYYYIAFSLLLETYIYPI